MGFQDDDPGLTIAPGQPLPRALDEEPDQEQAQEPALEPALEPAEGPSAGSEQSESEPAEPEPANDRGAGVAEPAIDPSEVPVHTETTDELVQSVETTSSYDHLWEKTVIRNIEDAAVRLDPEAGEQEQQLPTKEQPEPQPEPRDASPAHAVGPQSPYRTPAAVPGSGPIASRSGLIDPGSGLIDSVPWAVGPASQQAAPQPAVPTQQTPQQAWLPPTPGSAPEPLHGGDSGDSHSQDSDHDGQTIMKSSLAEFPADPVEPARQTASVNSPLVLAKVCSKGHANPPTYSQCAGCGLTLPGEGVQVPRPRLGRMRLSTGELIDLDQSLIIGRQPSVFRVQGGAMPRLVQVDSPGGDISRSHVEVRLEGWHVMLCDLKATNGTTLIRDGQAPRRLAQNEMAILLDGDIAELGDNISLRFEEIL